MFNNLAYPIIQAPMAGGILTPDLVAEVSNAGMLGSIASGYLSLDDCEQFIRQVKLLTAQPFIVNVFIEDDRSQEQTLPKPKKVIELEQQLAIFKDSTFVVPPSISQDKYANLLIKYKVAAVSTTFGMFTPQITQLLKLHNIKIIANCTSSDEAKYALQHGADALIIQGNEAGGHQASFLTNQANYLTTLELLSQVQSLNLGLPLIVSGGINPDNINNFWQAGADMVQLGTVFMLSNQSALKQEVINHIIDYNQQSGTSLASAITGKWVRGINNQLMRELTTPDYPFPIQHYATAYLRAQARKANNYAYAGLWLGQHANLTVTNTKQLIEQLKQGYHNYSKSKPSVTDSNPHN